MKRFCILNKLCSKAALSSLVVVFSSFLSLTACSDDSVDIAQVMENANSEAIEGNQSGVSTVSFEGKNYWGEELSIRFVGAKTAYANISAISEVAEGEAQCNYSATKDTIVLQVKKLPLGNILYSEEEFIRAWNSDSWRNEYIGFSDGAWAKDGFETEKIDSTSAKTKAGNSTKTTIDFSYTYEDDSEDADISGGKVVIKTESIEDGVKTTTTITRTYTAEVASKAESFYKKYLKLSENNWNLVRKAFVPFKFSYFYDYYFKETSINDKNEEEEFEMVYDIALIQHYTALENSSFSGMESEAGKLGIISDLDFKSGDIFVFVGKGDEIKAYNYELVSTDLSTQTFTFDQYEVIEGDDSEEDEPRLEYSGSITAKYSFVEDGDNSTLTLDFGKGKDANGKDAKLYLNSKSLTLEYEPVSYKMNLVNE